MKTIVVTFAFLAATVSFAQVFEVKSGSCKLENSSEIITLKNVPGMPFGRIAEGQSSLGDQVGLATYTENMIKIGLRGDTGWSYSIVPVNPQGDTPIVAGIYLTNPKGRAEWFSCELTVTSRSRRRSENPSSFDNFLDSGF